MQKFNFVENLNIPNIMPSSIWVICVTFLIFVFSVPIIGAVNTFERPWIWIFLMGFAFAILFAAWNINQERRIKKLEDEKPPSNAPESSINP